jgi:hypothetical protein
MDGFLALNLIYFLDFYFTLMFLVGVYRRFELYRNVVKLVISGHRWPNLLLLIRRHQAVFLTMTTVMPLLLALSLSVVQWIASRVIWPNAGVPPDGLTVAKLLEHWMALPIVLPLAIGMFGVDLYFLIYVAKFDPAELEKHFDQAEYWLKSPTAILVKSVTFGRIDPRRMVNDEVRKALVMAGDLLNTSLWYWNLQIALRFLFGLSLWLTWAFTRGYS